MDKDVSNHIRKLLEDGSFLAKDNDFLPSVDFDFSEETILITGAAGTIGSGLIKLLLKGPFKNLILLDNAESPLYYLQKELEAYQKPNVHFVLTDIRDEDSMQELFSTFKPSLIFHTAAYKHVPMVEYNIAEGVANNVFGTWNAAEAARKAEVETFVLVSTDKAVRPTNIMGASKRIAEMILQGLAQRDTKTRFCMVRFGNVLGEPRHGIVGEHEAAQ